MVLPAGLEYKSLKYLKVLHSIVLRITQYNSPAEETTASKMTIKFYQHIKYKVKSAGVFSQKKRAILDLFSLFVLNRKIAPRHSNTKQLVREVCIVNHRVSL